MGVEYKDDNNDGWADLIITALTGETLPVFKNDGKGGFLDASYASRLSEEAGLNLTEAHRGAGFADFDGDGRWR